MRFLSPIWFSAVLILGPTSHTTAAQIPGNPVFQGSRPRSGPPSTPVMTLNKQAEAAYSAGKHQDVIRLTTDGLRVNPRDHVALYLRGSSEVELGRQRGDRKMVRAGIADAREAIRISGPGKNSRYYLPYLFGMTSLAEIENQAEHATTAVKTADQILGIEKVSEVRAHLFYQRGRAHAVLKQFDKAETDFREALTRNQKFLAARMSLAEIYTATQKHQKARDTFTEMVHQFPNNPVVHNNRGQFLQRIGEHALAVTDFTTALRLNPQFFAAHTNRGYALMSMDDPEAAKADFAKSLAANPNQPLVHRLRAGCHLLQKRPDLAIAELETARKLADDEATNVDLGFARIINREYNQGAAILGKVRKDNAKAVHILPWRFAALVGDKQADAAKAEFTAAITRAESGADDCSWNDWLIAAVANAVPAKKLFDVAATDPKLKSGRLTEAHFFLGLKSEFGGDTGGARDHFVKAIALQQKNLAAYRGSLTMLVRLSGNTGDSAKQSLPR